MKTGYSRRSFLRGLLGASAVAATGKIWVVGAQLVLPEPFIRRGVFTEHPVDPNMTFKVPTPVPCQAMDHEGIFQPPHGESVLRFESVEGQPGVYRHIDTGQIFKDGVASTPQLTSAELKRLERQANWRRDGGTFDEKYRVCDKKWRTAFDLPAGTALAV